MRVVRACGIVTHERTSATSRPAVRLSSRRRSSIVVFVALERVAYAAVGDVSFMRTVLSAKVISLLALIRRKRSAAKVALAEVDGLRLVGVGTVTGLVACIAHCISCV